MKNNKAHPDVSRRQFLRWSGTLAAGLASLVATSERRSISMNIPIASWKP